MPYISQYDRTALEQHRPSNAGELNYVLTKVCMKYLEGRECYQTMNDILGALEGAKLEFYRRVVSIYEEEKMKINGDVYD